MIAALLDLEADTCNGCGLPRSETITILPEQSDAGTREWFLLPHNRKRRYRGTYATCQGCVAKNKAAAAQQAEDEKANTPAYIRESRVWLTRARADFPDIPQLDS